MFRPTGPRSGTPGRGLLAGALSLVFSLAAAWSPRAAVQTVPAGDAVATHRFTIPLSHRDYERLLEQAFDVPPGVRRVDVTYAVTGADARTVVDLGLRGPSGLRGWSGGGQSRIWVSALGATPGYLPGAIEPGAWAVVLGVPNIREGRADTVDVTVRLFATDLPDPPVVGGRGPGWYVGDLHAHSMHSDGRVRSRRGERVGTPVHRVVDAAVAAGLDFLALTDHNTASHWLDLDRLQPYYDDVLLLHGREVTTYRGHANTAGERSFGEFRLPAPTASPAHLLEPIAAGGAFVSINHPRLPDGEACMGCGWNDASAEVLRSVHGVEVVNGDTVEGPLAGWAYWAALLTRGNRLAAVGGSDDHSVDDDGDRRLGRPATVVWAETLSEAAIVDGLKAGRTYVRVRGGDGPSLERFDAERESRRAGLGETLPAGAAAVRLTATVGRATGQTLSWIVDGVEAGRAAVTGAPLTFEVRARDLRWVALVVRDAAGPTLMSGAIYVAAR